MSRAVPTPISQALAEGLLARRELKALMVRTDRPALLHLAGFLALMAATGILIWATHGTPWMLPAMFVHGVVLVHTFSLQHECVHYTAFRRRWLSDLMGNLCGFVILLPNRFFRYEHCDHHTFTQLAERDPERIPLPDTLGGYLLYLSSIPYWRAKFAELFRHVVGRLSPAERRFIPREEWRTVFLEARVMTALYAAIVLACAWTSWWQPLWYWWLPVALGEPVMRVIRMTEHVGCPSVADMKRNTRTTLIGAPLRFLCWNMNYHAEHHYAAGVPFHALPRLHQALRGHLHVEPRGYLGAHLDMLAQLRGTKPRCDPPGPTGADGGATPGT